MLSTILAGLVATAAASPLKPKKADATTASAYASNSGLSMALASIDAPVQGAGSPPSGGSVWSLSIDDSSNGHRQTIDGFGAAVTDATVTEFNTLSSDMLSDLLNTLMTSDGANFALFRHTIGSSDLSGDPAYTYCDTGNASNPSLNSFGLGDRGNAMAALLAQMQKLNSNTKIVGSPWSPPGWMKLNGDLIGSSDCNNLNDGYDTDCPATGPDVSSTFAQYFVKYLQAYQAAGVDISAITIQNEPMNSQGGFPTMYVYDQESATLIQNSVGPALSQAGLNVEIWGLDHNTEYQSYAETVINNAGQYVNTIAWHCYDSPDWSVLSDFAGEHAGVKQYMTECYTPSSGSDSAWNFAPDFVMGPLQNYASGAIAWTLGSDSSDGPHLSGQGACGNCQGLVTVNDDGSYTLNSQYYMMAQFSKFMPVGSTVLAGNGSHTYDDGTGIQSVATLNSDGSRTIVVINNFPNDVYLTLNTTSEQWSGNIPTTSTTTWILPASS